MKWKIDQMRVVNPNRPKGPTIPAKPNPKKPLMPKKPVIKATGMAKGGSVKKAAPKHGMAMGGVAVSSGVNGGSLPQEAMDALVAKSTLPKKALMETPTGLPAPANPMPTPRGPRGIGPTNAPIRPKGPKGTPVKPRVSLPRGTGPTDGGYNKEQWATLQEKSFRNLMKGNTLTPEQKTQAQTDYKTQFGSLPTGMSKGGVVKKGMAKGGMVKKGKK